MSLAAIQDSLVKTSLVQQTQARGDDMNRGHENAIAAQQKEQDRQEDQVVIHAKEAEQGNIRDEEKERRQGKNDEEPEEEGQQGESEILDGEDEEDGVPRAKMRRINIVI